MDRDFKIKMEMEELGMELAKQCAGLPLAIIVLGGLLATKKVPSEWENVRNNVNLYLGGKRVDREYSVVDGVLALSYNELPYCLKPCFLHLGHFPEDYDIPCTTLFKIWVAEGFVSHCQQGETMEDVAERYLRELVNRSIVQVSRMGSVGRVKTCRLHDLMRDFCLSKTNQENYLQTVRVTNLNEKLSSNKVRRLVVHGEGDNDIDFGHYMQTPNLRSFLLFWVQNIYPTIKSSVINFKFLRIMSLENCRIEKETSKKIGGLIHLRYLAIKCCEIEALPSSIENLRYLQSLIIVYNYNCEVELPNVLWKLEQLRHIVLEGCVREPGSLKLGNMRELQTLQCQKSYFNISDIGVLANSSNLKKLGLKINFGGDEIPSVTLSRLSSVSIRVQPSTTEALPTEKLKIFFSSCPQLVKLFFYGEIEKKLPEWQHFPEKLVKLTLENCYLTADPMPILEKLLNLGILRLYWYSFVGALLICSSKGFPKLQSLHFDHLPNLVEWRVDVEAMPNLSQLHISWCKELEMIPEGINFITTLRQLKIDGMSKEFEDRVQREGEDFYKVRHVPSIIIRDTPTHHQ